MIVTIARHLPGYMFTVALTELVDVYLTITVTGNHHPDSDRCGQFSS